MEASRKRPLVIGLVGGIASGKSFVARTLAEFGASVFDADAAGHAALQDSEVQRGIRERWGVEVFDSNHNINRAAVAGIVFAKTDAAQDELRFLESLTHPVITRLMQAALQQAQEENAPAFVLDAAVMRKAGWDKQCDDILFIEAPRDVRLARARARGWTEAEFSARESAQELLSEKRNMATRFIENSADQDQTRRQLSEYWHDRIGTKHS